MPSSSANIRDIVGVDDFVLLDNVDSVEEFMDNLRKRFHKDIIYTYIGQVLISVNPYKELPIYRKEIAQQYKNTNTYEAKPHIFAIAATSYRSMIDELHDQCILISGESGSGKTEASKKILEYIAYNCVQSQTLQNVKDKLLSTNPVLEVFGNAKTARNNNSSRFGKYMDVEFNRIGQPIGGHINIFMLEKSRVIYQNPNEQNFHIFYQLLRGLDDETLKELHLKRDIDAYFYLNQTTQDEFENIENQFDMIKNAFKHFEFSDEEERSVYKIIASILHLGNIGFYADEDDNEERAVIANVKPVTMIAGLLECDRKLLASALTTRAIEARNETLLSSLNREQAIYGRDALAKAVYERLFCWLVSRLNSSLKCTSKVPAKLLMGLVDIYGFEVFQTNHFEQFCINYCNEKLQQLFIELTLKQEQEEYRREKIDWEPVKYFNNKIICDMIEEKHHGIIAYLDEECFRPGEANDFTFLDKLERNLGTNPHFSIKRHYSNKNRNDSFKRQQDDHFTITHYAGEVEYTVTGFMDKNNDQLHRDLKKAMLSSKNAILSKLFHIDELNSLKRPNTTATQFRASLSQLMTLLSTKQPWYIRCIKPNEEQVRANFDENIVAHQIQYLGLMENLRVRRAGFAYRRRFEDFLERYKCICPQTWPHYRGAAKDGVAILMKHLQYDDNQYKLGLTKIFIRFPETFFQIEDTLQQQKHVLAAKIQALFRGYRQRLIYERLRLSAIQIQSHVRKMIAKKTFEQRKRAVETVRRFIKGFITRRVPTNDENDFFLRQVKVEWLRRLSKNLPKSVLDTYWMPASPSCDRASELLSRMHRSYLARRYVVELSQERKSQLTEKLFAERLFKDRKGSYLDSVAEPFAIDRIGLPSLESQMKMNKNLERIKMDREKLQYLNNVNKYDRHGYKLRERLVIITDKKLYLFDPKNYSSKEAIPLSGIASVVLSNRCDGVFLIKVSPELKNQKGDLILESSPKHIELITKLIKVLGVNKLVITDSNAIQHTVNGGKEGKISFIDGCRNEVSKNKTDGTLNVMTYHSSA